MSVGRFHWPDRVPAASEASRSYTLEFEKTKTEKILSYIAFYSYKARILKNFLIHKLFH